MERTVVCHVTREDLRSFIYEEIAKRDLNNSRDALLKRFENVFVGVREVAAIHMVSPSTVRSYVADRIIEPELRAIENGKYKFRLSYILTLDFKELKNQLKLKKII